MKSLFKKILTFLGEVHNPRGKVSQPAIFSSITLTVSLFMAIFSFFGLGQLHDQVFFALLGSAFGTGIFATKEVVSSIGK